ncbi:MULTISPECIES: hypothetical protein [unclassified Streptomyces]|uniref:hypothetical protein n=1 Tax=unclassified Streptomyces TaxID=2593676 RepID=UPI0014882F5F|nr:MULTISPECIES: hypothetical protein [unclassified Streptomyces]
MSAVDPHAEAHRLKNERRWGARRIARELGISRYEAEKLLKRPLPQPVAEVTRAVAEPVAEVADEERPVADKVAGHLDTLVGHTPTGGRRLVIDLDQFPGLAEDLALLQRTGAKSPAHVVDFAVDRLATAYRTARARGLLRDGQAFEVVSMWLRPTARVRRAA